MKKMIVWAMILMVGTSSCVSKKRYMEAEASARKSIEGLQSDLSLSRVANNDLTAKVAQLNKEIEELKKAIRSYENINNASMSEQQKLNALLQQQIRELETQAQKINELKGFIAEQRSRLGALLNNVQSALSAFSPEEINVTQKEGKVYVMFADKLLFQPGSAKVDKRGKEALERLAGVIIENSDIDISIEGHTDNKPINTVQFKDNWDLSVIRATSVVRILTQEYGVDPLHIVPMGRADLVPVESNDSVEGRSKNRRTEIILSPKIDKLIEILEN